MNPEIPATNDFGVPQRASLDPALGYSSAELGDVVDALEEAAVSLKAVIRNQARSVVDEADQFVRNRPMAALALAGGIGYLLARLTR